MQQNKLMMRASLVPHRPKFILLIRGSNVDGSNAAIGQLIYIEFLHSAYLATLLTELSIFGLRTQSIFTDAKVNFSPVYAEQVVRDSNEHVLNLLANQIELRLN